MSEVLPIWVLYDHPKDFPNCYVARLWLGEAPTMEMIMSPVLEDLRDLLRQRGLVMLMRHPEDDPVIVETWL